MAESKNDLLEHYQATGAELLDAIDGLTDEQMVDPSIDGWAVKDPLLHLAFWHDMRADDVRRISAGHDSAWSMAKEDDEALNQMGYLIRRELSLDQARWEFERSRRALLEA